MNPPATVDGMPVADGRATSSEDVTHGVLATLDAAGDGRLAEVMRAVIRHLHDLAREVRLTPDELFAAAQFLTECGKISSPARHELLMLSDTLGLTMVVDTLASGAVDGALESSVLGPFYRADAPLRQAGDDISRGPVDGDPLEVLARVVGTAGQPLAGAVLDVWGTNASGRYENVDPDQPDMNLRGRFTTDGDGRVHFRTVKPVSYPIPDDGPAGRLLHGLGRHNMRPAHLHLIVSAPGHRSVVTELYTDDDPYLASDAVFGVKPSLVVHYERSALPGPDGPVPGWRLIHQFVLVPGDSTEVSFSAGAEVI
jgi:protocatechuate 3,4-dioxygenase beta subunit